MVGGYFTHPRDTGSPKAKSQEFHVQRQKHRPRPNTVLISEAVAAKAKEGNLADLLSFQLKAAQIPHTREALLVPDRRFRTDILVDKLAIECDGATWIGGRHSRGYGIESDSEKQNLLVALGYRPMRVTRKQIKDGRALQWIEQARKA